MIAAIIYRMAYKMIYADAFVFANAKEYIDGDADSRLTNFDFTAC